MSDNKPFELMKYIPHPEKKGCLKYVGMATYRECFEVVRDRLKSVAVDHHGGQCSLWDLLEYGGLSPVVEYGDTLTVDSQIPEDARIAAYAMPGSNEGHYVHVDAISKSGERHPMLLLKSFGGMKMAYQVAAEVSAALHNDFS